MAEILTKCGTAVLVDDDIAEQNRHFTWRIDKFGYVVRTTNVNGKKGRIVLLHRVVMRCHDSNTLVDHRDMNPLNNTRLNLRLATRSQNSQNTMKAIGCSSLFKGVTWSKRSRKWQATIKGGAKRIYLGLFDSEHEAGHAYNRAAIEIHGEFARLNPVGIPQGANHD